jgi:hypothetical protein
MIKTVIRLRNDMVLVLDENGEQIPEYQGYYQVVKNRIIDDAPAGAVFNHWFGYEEKPDVVSEKVW